MSNTVRGKILGGNFWRINGSKVFGEEKFGESVGSMLKILAFINIGGEILANCQPFAKFAKIFPLQNFPTYGSCRMDRTRIIHAVMIFDNAQPRGTVAY